MPRTKKPAAGPTPFNDTWRSLVYAVCERDGISQDELGEALGMTGRNSVSGAMRKRNQVSMSKAAKLADLAGLNEKERIRFLAQWADERMGSAPYGAFVKVILDHLEVAFEEQELHRLRRKAIAAHLAVETEKGL